MQNRLIHNLIYRYHRFGFYFYAVKYTYQDRDRKSNRIIYFLKAIIYNLKLFCRGSGYYEYLEIPITTKCSLKCINCSNLIPCYQKPSDYDLSILLKSIQTFLDCIRQIVYIRVLGGEPFLSKNLYSVLRVLVKSSKVRRIEVVTNGTIIPSDRKVIRILRNKRIIVCISEYPMVDRKKLIDFLEKNHIQYRIDKMKFWVDYGNIEKKNRTKKQLKRQFSICGHVCWSLVNGQVHLCPRSSHGTDLGFIHHNDGDYVNLLDSRMNVSLKRKKLNDLSRKKCIMACDFCDYGTKYSKKVPVARQIR